MNPSHPLFNMYLPGHIQCTFLENTSVENTLP